MQLLIMSDGSVRCLYDETIDLPSLGALNIRRGSHVEPTVDGEWTADMSPVGGPVLGPFASRSAALQAEREWLNEHVIVPPAVSPINPFPSGDAYCQESESRR